jgi:hypothetical protein
MNELAGKFMGKKISPSSSEPPFSCPEIFLPKNSAIFFDAAQMPASSPIAA